MFAFIQRSAPETTAGFPAAPPRTALPLLGVVAVLVFVLTAIAAATPASTLAATAYTARCDGVALRTWASPVATRKAVVPQGTKVAAVAKITGASWNVACNGITIKGSTWLRITMINGRTASSRYGVSYVYAAYGLFKYVSPTTLLKAGCDGVSLRTSASTSASRKAILAVGTKFTVAAGVAGTSWTTTCLGPSSSGTTWSRISEVNGKSVSSLYGVSYVYVARGLLVTLTTDTSSSETTPKPSPTPTPKPSPTATPAPSPTATPKPSPTATPTATPSPAPSASPTPTPSPTSGYLEGIDVSHWQGTINWQQVAGAGKRFAYLKASESIDYVDPTYATNRAQAKSMGLKVGAYHFARPGTNAGDATAEADWFVRNASPASGELLPVLDLESSGGLTTSELQAWVRTFMDRVYATTGVKGAIYVSPSFWSNYMGNTASIATAGYKTLWVAHWTTASSPTVPANNWNGNGWTFWQYTSSGTVPGIAGRVDLDRYRFGSFAPVLIP